MKVCGPKYALCGLIISAWGIVQLGLMGIFFYFRSVSFIEDIALAEGSFKSADDFYTKVNQGYGQNAQNCWIAALLYLFTFVFSGYQFYRNSRQSLSV